MDLQFERDKEISRCTCIFREDDKTKTRRTTTFDLRKVCNLLRNLLPRWQKTAFKRTTMKDWIERADAHIRTFFLYDYDYSRERILKRN